MFNRVDEFGENASAGRSFNFKNVIWCPRFRRTPCNQRRSNGRTHSIVCMPTSTVYLIGGIHRGGESNDVNGAAVDPDAGKRLRY